MSKLKTTTRTVGRRRRNYILQERNSEFVNDQILAMSLNPGMCSDNVPERSKPQKYDRRLMKKHNRVRHALQAKGLELSTNPTEMLCVYNAGLDNGVTREQVLTLFEDFGQVTQIVMIPQKPYSFVCYSNVKEAEIAQVDMNGFKMPPPEDEGASCTTLLYTFYVRKVPEIVTQTDYLPPGLILVKDFITSAEESKLLAVVDWRDTSPEVQRELKHRRVKHYGYEFKYGVNNVDPGCPLPQGIPPACEGLLRKALTMGLVKHYPDQLTINEYHPGQGIPPHVDTPSAFEDGLISLSLGSQAVMEFHHPDGRQASVLLPQRSLLVMTGESRYIWSHGITPRKSDIITSPDGGLTLAPRGTRTSFTFRKIIVHNNVAMEEQASYSDQIQRFHPFSELEASRLETVHVHKVYEAIAGHFSQTRHSAWPEIAEFIKAIPPGSLLADIGCGNGKYLGINKHLFEVGSDRSENLASICSGRGYQTFVGDVLSIPLRSEVFDVCICIAVIHHLSTKGRREKALNELVRILAPGGKLLIYVWAMEQEKDRVKSKYLKGTKKSGVEKQVRPEESNECPTNMEERLEGQRDKAQCEIEQNTVSRNEQDNVESQSEVSYLPLVSTQAIRLENSAFAKNSSESDEMASHDTHLPVHVNRTPFQQQDMLVPWQLKNKVQVKVKSDQGKESQEGATQSSETFHRYYHVFKQGELESLCGGLDNVVIKKSYYDQGNWCVLMEKSS